MIDIISRDRSVIPAADVETQEELKALINATAPVEGIGGYKIGLQLATEFGLRNLVPMIKEITSLPVILDPQKTGTDIPDMGPPFMRTWKRCGVDAVIIFPQAGPVTQREFIKAAQGEGLGVFVGGEMTHKGYLVKEGGYIADDAPMRMYNLAIDLGVNHFIIPGNRLESVQQYIALFNERLGEGNYTVGAPGFITQGGEISDFGKAAGNRWHAIVGSGIYKQPDMRKAAELVTSQIR